MSGRKRVAKMLIALAVLFAVCWLPYYIVSLYLDFTTKDTKNFLLALDDFKLVFDDRENLKLPVPEDLKLPVLDILMRGRLNASRCL
jgi:hypothetical protein